MKFTKTLIAVALCLSMLLGLPLIGGRAAAAGSVAPLTFASSKNYGSRLDDAFKGATRTKDGGYVAAGYSMARNPDLPGWENTRNDNGNAYNDGVVVKFAEDLHVEWARSFGYTQTDTLFGCDVLKDGTIAAVGTSTYVMPEGSENNATVSGYILLIDPDFPDEYVELHVGGSKGDQLQAVTATSDGGFAAAGFSASADSAEWGDKKVSATMDGVIVKYNARGELEFAVCCNVGADMGLENVKRTRFFGIAEDSDGNLLAVGDMQIAANLYNAVAVKIDGKTGRELWYKTIGSTLTAAPTDGADYHTSCLVGAAVLSDGSYVAVGTANADASTEEGWTVTGSVDGIVLRYAPDGTLISAESIGTIDRTAAKNGSVDFTGVIALDDGGYMVYGSTNQTVYEKSVIDRGYDWTNSGQHDVLLLRYDSDSKPVWSQTYGGENGDYVNDMVVTPEGEFVAFGEATGEADGSLKYANTGKVDATVFAAGYYQAAQSDLGVPDSENVKWADGEYEDEASGYGGFIRVKVTVEDGAIKSVEEISQQETAAYYRKAKVLYNTIVEQQSANVDSVSGATMSSNGIKHAAANALSQSAGKYVADLIDAFGEVTGDNKDEKRDSVWAARAAYEELGTYSRTFVPNYDKLEAAEVYTGRDENAGSPGTSETAEPGVGGKPAQQPSDAPDTYYSLQQDSMGGINWNAFRSRGITGQGAVVAILDTGLTGSHQDLDYSLIRQGRDLIGGGAMTDTNGHGTAVAGIIQSTGNNGMGTAGLLSKAELIPVRVGAGNTSVKATDLAEGIRYAADEGAQVITMSIGLKADAKDLDKLEEAVKYAYEKGVIMVAAVGNSGSADSTDDPLLYPAAYDEVIGVGALLQDNKVRPSSQKNNSVFVTASGTDMALLALSRSSRCKIASGTSYSAPIVAAMAAAAKAADPTVTPAQFAELLKSTSVDAGDEGYDTAYGWGIVDLKAFADIISPEEETYVLMNIPYGDFYAAEGTANVDAVTSATLSKTRGTLCAGSYHVSADGSDITGVIYPVKVDDLSDLSPYKQVTDEDVVSITVVNRGVETTTEYVGKDALFENPSYSYYVLSETPAYYKELTVNGDGTLSFGKAVGEKTEKTATAELFAGSETGYGDYQLNITGLTGEGETIDKIFGVVVHTAEGGSYGLRHVENIWRQTMLAWSVGYTTQTHGCTLSYENYVGSIGQTVTGVTYYTTGGIIDLTFGESVKLPLMADIAAEIESENTATVTGIPADIENPAVTLVYTVGSGRNAQKVPVEFTFEGGKITLAEGKFILDTNYTVTVTSDNYASMAATFVRARQKGDITGDERIDNADLVTLARQIVGLETLDNNQLKAADITGDGNVDNGDLVTLARFIVGIA